MHWIRPMREVAPIVRAEVERALDLNPSDPRPRFLLGAVALAHDYDWAAAETHFTARQHRRDRAAVRTVGALQRLGAALQSRRLRVVTPMVDSLGYR
jgi:hypothetical protein